jgi:hypothetical protein
VKRALWFLVLAALLAAGSAAAQDDYSFDIDTPEAKTRAFTYDGSIEIKPSLASLDRAAVAYFIRYYNDPQNSPSPQYNLRLQLNGEYKKGDSRLTLRTNTDVNYAFSDHAHAIDLYEGYYAWTPNPALTLNAGKTVVKWGKGYAWNPVAFIDRPKDPDDPELSLEGYTMIAADAIKSFNGPLQNAAFTLAALPATGDVNPDFGGRGHINLAGKLYLLYNDTDLDFLFLTGQSRPGALGFDFSKNLRTNFEVHGEWARYASARNRTVDVAGNVSSYTTNANSWLLGARYLDQRDTTYIFEFYRNGMGLPGDDAARLFNAAHSAYETWLAGGGEAGLKNARLLSSAVLGSKNPMRKYIYFKTAWNEPHNILYFNPALVLSYNVGDHSFSLMPELNYNPRKNEQWRLRFYMLRGRYGSEYGEKLFDNKIEFSWKFFF